LNGGALFVNLLASVTPSAAPGANNMIHVGPNGGKLAAFGTFTPGTTPSAGAEIPLPVIAEGAVDIGALSNVNPSSGAIILTGTSNQFSTINVNQAPFGSLAPGSIGGATINLNGGYLALLPGATGTTPVVYTNTINVLQDAVLADSASFYSGQVSTAPVTARTINLGNAKLTVVSNALSIGNLQLQGNGVLAIGSLTSSINIASIAAQAGQSYSLSFTQTTRNGFSWTVTGAVDAPGPIALSNVGVEFDGSFSPSAAGVTVGDHGMLAGVANIHRPVTFSNISNGAQILSPGTMKSATVSNPGTLGADSLDLSPSTTLKWDLGLANVVGGATNDLVAVLGDLDLDGSLSIARGTGFGAGTYTLFTYGGTLTDDGLTLPAAPAGLAYALDLSTQGFVNLVVTNPQVTPEAGTLGILVLGAGMLVRRRRG
jgi:fibronectin-binding autotransporter adhesin